MGISLDVLTKTISVTSPTTSVTIQELVNVIRDWEDDLCNMTYTKVIDAVGKADLGDGITTGIVVSLNPEWQIQFWGGSGLTKISGGTIVGGVGDEPAKATGTAGDLTIVQTPVNTTIVSTSGSGATAQEVWEYGSARTLSNPDDYKADVSGMSQTGEYDTTLSNIQTETDKIPAMIVDLTFLKDIDGGSWKREGTQMIFYKSDNVTEIARFDLKKFNGTPATEADEEVAARIRV